MQPQLLLPKLHLYPCELLDICIVEQDVCQAECYLYSFAANLPNTRTATLLCATFVMVVMNVSYGKTDNAP